MRTVKDLSGLLLRFTEPEPPEGKVLELFKSECIIGGAGTVGTCGGGVGVKAETLPEPYGLELPSSERKKKQTPTTMYLRIKNNFQQYYAAASLSVPYKQLAEFSAGTDTRGKNTVASCPHYPTRRGGADNFCPTFPYWAALL